MFFKAFWNLHKIKFTFFELFKIAKTYFDFISKRLDQEHLFCALKIVLWQHFFLQLYWFSRQFLRNILESSSPFLPLFWKSSRIVRPKPNHPVVKLDILNNFPPYTYLHFKLNNITDSATSYPSFFLINWKFNELPEQLEHPPHLSKLHFLSHTWLCLSHQSAHSKTQIKLIIVSWFCFWGSKSSYL